MLPKRIPGNSSGGNWKSNAKWDAYGTAAKRIGGCLLAASIASNAVDIALSQDRVSTTKRVLGRWAGALYFGTQFAECGAFLGSFIGPEGTVVGGLLAGLVGGIFGAIVGDQLADDGSPLRESLGG